MKVVAVASLVLPAALTACASLEPEDELYAISSPAPFQRALPATPAQVADAAAAALRDLGLPVAFVDGGTALVLSGTVTVHEHWGGRPIQDRLLCGVPFLHMGDREVGGWIPYTGGDDEELERAIEYTRALPIELRMGFEAEPTVDGSSVLLLMVATGHIASPTPLGPREVACLPTRTFVDEVFGAIAGRLPGGSPAVDGGW